MQILAHISLISALLVALSCAGWGCLASWRGETTGLPWIERGQLVVAALFTFSSAILLRALVARDFSFSYVAEYTNSFLPMFYTVTAFWAGQAGSLLFWAWTISLLGGVFLYTRGYRSISPRTRLLFWIFLLGAQAFFLLLLTGVTNPFLILEPAAREGQGLNPLLQNAGMIFHPPLLFFGYAGFAIPACLALASRLTEEKCSWVEIGHNWNIVSWVCLTAGIILGAWWSYMELGWGGYWAWDPVENASLIPWFSATAFLHTALIERRRGALQRTNLVLVTLTLTLSFFATYLVRSGVVSSLHAFGEGGVGKPLLIFILSCLAVLTAVAAIGQRTKGRRLTGLLSKQGMLVLTVWLLLALGLIVLVGTMWPVISLLWEPNPVGVNQGFYNSVCLPLFALMTALLVFCPWLGWKDTRSIPRVVFALAAGLPCMVAVLWSMGIRLPVPLFAASSAIAAAASILLLMALHPDLRARVRSWGAYGTHLGLALIVLGVAFSGPYQEAREQVVELGQAVVLGDYEFVYTGLREDRTDGLAIQEARIEVRKHGQPVGELTPQRRVYKGYDHPHSEVSTIPGLGDELYATIHDIDGGRLVPLKVSIHPLVNWVWIGSILLCLLPLLVLRRPPTAGTGGTMNRTKE